MENEKNIVLQFVRSSRKLPEDQQSTRDFLQLHVHLISLLIFARLPRLYAFNKEDISSPKTFYCARLSEMIKNRTSHARKARSEENIEIASPRVFREHRMRMFTLCLPPHILIPDRFDRTSRLLFYSEMLVCPLKIALSLAPSDQRDTTRDADDVNFACGGSWDYNSNRIIFEQHSLSIISIPSLIGPVMDSPPPPRPLPRIVRFYARFHASIKRKCSQGGETDRYDQS